MLDVAIVGCGAVLEDLHLVPLAKIVRGGAVNVVALVDNNATRAARFQREFRHAHVFASLEDAYAAKPVHLTFIASPPGLHLTHGLAAFKSNSHVFVEKPMVTTGVDADRLTAAGKAAGRVLAVGLPRRFFPHVAEVAGMIARGELGDELTFVYREGSPYKWPAASEAIFLREKSGGGVLMDKGVHALDTLDLLFGAAEFIGAEDDSLQGGVDSNARIELRYPQYKATGVVQLSWDQDLNSGIWIKGSRGEVMIGLNDIGMYRHRQAGGVWRRVRATFNWPATVAERNPGRGTPVRYPECVFYEWINVIRAVRFGEEPAMDGLKATRVIRTIEAAYQATKPMDFPWLSAPERAVGVSRHWRVGV